MIEVHPHSPLKAFSTQRTLLVIAVMLYVLGFVFLYPTLGAAVGSFSVLPVAIASWRLGFRVGIITAVLMLPLNAVLLNAAGETEWLGVLWHGAPGFIALFVVAGVVGRLHDLEVRVKHELSERRQAENEARALYNALSFLFKASDLADLGQQIVQAVIQEFQQVDCGLMLVDQQQNTMHRLARGGKYQVKVTTVLQLDGAGLVPEAVRTGKMVYAPDVFTVSHYLMNDARTRSELVIPLGTAQGVVGVLDLQSTQPDAFNQHDQRVLLAFAERAAAALQNMLLYEQLNQSMGELEWRVAKRTAELHQTKEHVEMILNNSGDAIVLTDPTGIMRQVNTAFSLLFGYASDETFQVSLMSLVESQQLEVLDDELRALLENREPARMEIICRCKDGRVFPADLALAPLFEEEQLRGIICSFRDITERKQVEDDLRAALEREKELNLFKARFTSMMSHEFRTPLAVILSSAETLERYQERLSEAQRVERLSKIQQQVKRLIELLNDVLTIGKAETIGLEFQPSLLPLKPFCQEIVTEIQEIAGSHPVRFSCTPPGIPVVVDAKLLRQAISNLLSNAIKYSPQGGTVNLDVTAQNSDVIFRVQDEGIGIPEADQKRLFEVFHRATNVGTIQGTGLGLIIVKRAVEAHGGTIEVASQVDVGTTFTLCLPIHAAESESLLAESG